MLTTPQHRELEKIIRADPTLMQLLEVARDVDLPQWRIVAGCVYQTVWNVLTKRAPGTGIKDYDLIYFDDSDLSAAAEAATAERFLRRLSDFSGAVDVNNQARVHLWFEAEFGIPYPALQSADESITRYAVVAHAVGVRLTRQGQLDIYAPFGLDDIFGMICRPNYALPNKATHEKKSARIRAIWPEATVITWD